MIAAHLENLLFLLLLVVAGLFQLLGRAARKASGDEEESTPRPAPRMPKPIPRAPAQSDEERIRKFLEALGQPPASTPPPRVVPRTNIPPRPLAPVQPPLPKAWKVIREERRKPDVIRREPPPPETARRLEKIFPPTIPGVPAFQVHEGPLPVEPPPIIKTPVEAYAPATRSITKGAELKTNIATLLASKSGLRDAIILREIFGPPRSLQSLDLL
ncbi:MAG TPA: hypothetical protein VJ420_07495 [Candidatus Udaeobacter sp.]|nr:hypothetical protein [Candidatus Udaeobacter sp.]